MLQHRGVTESTLRVYDGSLAELQATVGADPAAYTAESVRRFVLERARRHGVSYAKLTASAVRTFLQFLAATGRCRSGLAHAIPAFASWNNTSMPRFLIPEDLERVVASCTGDTIGLRDKAILLLLARLGLRAGDVVRLTLKDLDWRTGTLVVCGKGRRHDLLPMPQEVGDAIKDYLERGRPSCQVHRGIYSGFRSRWSISASGDLSHCPPCAAPGGGRSTNPRCTLATPLGGNQHVAARCISCRHRSGASPPLPTNDRPLC